MRYETPTFPNDIDEAPGGVTTPTPAMIKSNYESSLHHFLTGASLSCLRINSDNSSSFVASIEAVSTTAPFSFAN